MVAHIISAHHFLLQSLRLLPQHLAHQCVFRYTVLSPQVRCSFGQEGTMKKTACWLVYYRLRKQANRVSFYGFPVQERANQISFHGFPVQEEGKPDFFYGFPVQLEGKPNFLLWVFTCKKLQNGTVFAQNGVLAGGEAILGPDMQPAVQRHGGIQKQGLDRRGAY